MRTVSVSQLRPKADKSKQLQKPKAVTPSPPPVSPKVSVAAPIVNVDTTALAAVIKELVNKPAPTAEAPVAKPTEWTFTVKRDSRGLIETITAKAK